jgi:cyclopropane-fatty-acyl-phospholipid synthase
VSSVQNVAFVPAHLPLRQRVAAKVILSGLSRWRGGALKLALPDGTIRAFGNDAGPSVVVTVKDWKFFWRVLTAADIGAGEAYMEGEFSTSDLAELCRLFLHDHSMNQRSVWALPTRLRHALRRLTQGNTLSGSRRNIKYHYDLSNDLYRLFLDPTMMYSCAVFERDDDTLEAAQRHKVDDICRRLHLAPGMHVLEIGSGWGSFAIHAAQHYGCRVTSLTLSDEQLALARERATVAGVSASVDIQLCDYRQVTGIFDRIASIEMFEAVGYEYYGKFFETCSRVLTPGGRMFLQTITIPDQDFDRYRRDVDFIKKYIFPGGALASLHGITNALKRHTDMRIDWLRDIGLHYVKTLRCWRERFMSRVPEVHRLGFDDRFVRMWEFYLACCEAGFAVRHLGDLQMVLVKPGA